MKYLLAICSLVIMVGCATESEDTNHKVYKGISEKQIYENGNLKYEFGNVLVSRLEDLGAPLLDYEKDTGGRGVDAIPLTVSEKWTYTFTKDEDLSIVVKLFNKSTNAFIDVLSASQNQNSIYLEVGEYILQLNSLINYVDTSLGFQNVFLYPLGNIFNNRFSRYSCQNSSMGTIDLTNYDLQKVNLSGSDISSANLRNIDLKDAICENTNFHGSILFAGRLTYANFYKADFTNADLQYSFFSYSDCRGAVFCNANHYGWIITGVKRDNTTKCWNE